MPYEQPLEPSVESTPGQRRDLPRVVELAQLIQFGEQQRRTVILTPEQQETGRKRHSEFVGRVLARRLNR